MLRHGWIRPIRSFGSWQSLTYRSTQTQPKMLGFCYFASANVMVISFKSPSKVEACLSRLKKRDTLKDIDCSLTDKIAKNDKYAPITSTYATLSIFRAHRMNVIANAQETVNFPITQATLAGIHREDRGRGLGQAE